MAAPKKNTWLGHIETVSSKNYNPDELQMEGIEKSLSVNDHFHALYYHSFPATYLIDYRTGSYTMMSRSSRIALGYDPKEFIDNGVGFTIDVYHAGDLKLFNEKIFPDRLELLKSIPPEQHGNYIFSYSFRFRNKDGEYITLLQRNSFIKSDAAGRPLLSLGMVYNISHYARENPVIQTVEKINTPCDLTSCETVYKKSYYLHDEDSLFSRREKEVLLWIADGLTSKEIACRTYLSESTIINHRKNMLLKSGTKNVAELITFAVKHSVI